MDYIDNFHPVGLNDYDNNEEIEIKNRPIAVSDSVYCQVLDIYFYFLIRFCKYFIAIYFFNNDAIIISLS